MALYESIAGSIGSAMVSKFIQGGGSGPQTPDYTDFRFSSGLFRDTVSPEKAGVGQDIGQVSYLQTKQFWDSYLREYLRG